MSTPNQLKNYLKAEVQSAIGISVDSPEFDKIMGAFANAIDKYLKQDVKVEIAIEATGPLDITPSFPVPVPGAQTLYEVATKTTTQGTLV